MWQPRASALIHMRKIWRLRASGRKSATETEPIASEQGGDVCAGVVTENKRVTRLFFWRIRRDSCPSQKRPQSILKARHPGQRRGNKRKPHSPLTSALRRRALGRTRGCRHCLLPSTFPPSSSATSVLSKMPELYSWKLACAISRARGHRRRAHGERRIHGLRTSRAQNDGRCTICPFTSDGRSRISGPLRGFVPS
jgi:hypothetical protein